MDNKIWLAYNKSISHDDDDDDSCLYVRNLDHDYPIRGHVPEKEQIENCWILQSYPCTELVAGNVADVSLTFGESSTTSFMFYGDNGEL